MSIRHFRSCLSALAALACLSGLTAPAQAQSGPPTGRLSCSITAGIGVIVKSQRPLECRFKPRRGPVQHYIGVVRHFGLDLGSIKGTTMAWRVYGPYARASLGVLNGRYKAVTTGTTGGAGTSGPSVLVGGTGGKVTLQPLSTQLRRGFNVAVGVTRFELTLAPRRR